MMLNRKIPCVVGSWTAVIFSLMSPNSLGAAEPVKSETKIRSASVGYAGSAGACIDAFGSFNVIENAVNKNSEPPRIELFMSVFDTCSGTVLVDATGFPSLEEGEVIIDKNARVASVDADTEIFSYLTGENIPVSIQLHWEAVEQASTSKELTISHGPFDKSTSDARAKSAAAMVAGTLTVDNINVSSAPVSFAGISTNVFRNSFHEKLP